MVEFTVYLEGDKQMVKDDESTVIAYEPKDIYYPIIESEQRYLAYGRINKVHYDFDGVDMGLVGIARALVIKMCGENEKGLTYCCVDSFAIFGSPRLSRLIKFAIKSLRLEDSFYYAQGGNDEGEIACLKNKCSFRFVDTREAHGLLKLRAYSGLKMGWIFVDDEFDREKLEQINPMFREPQSKIVFSFSTHVGSDFQKSWFYDEHLKSMPDESIFIY